MPFGTKEASFTNSSLRYLAVEQVMWDYVDLLKSIKADDTTYPNIKDKATIVMGGSYGGMLASWIRMKYPQHFQGALAASAPILWFKGQTDPNAYTKIASDVFRNVGGDTCYNNISRGFYDLANLKYDSTKYEAINQTFKLCERPTKPEDVQTLIGIISDSLGTMAMVNYPYATSFVNPLPAWPMNASCAAINDYVPPTSQDKPNAADVTTYNYTHIEALQRATNVFLNYSGESACLNISAAQSAGLDESGWDAQTCNEFPMPQGDDPSQSCFTWVNWDEDDHTKHCQSTYNMTPQYDWALDYFGGRDVAKDFQSSSNIIFSNGNLDPWHAGGVLDNVMPYNHVIFIQNSAHHFDLRLPNEADPYTVTQARA